MQATSSSRTSSAAWICVAGFVALVVAMGIGRFAFTPLLPLMQGAGQLDLTQGAWLASANYVGYLAGALSVARVRMEPRALVRAGVLMIALLTAAMGWTDHFVAWLLLRFASGALSAWVLVGTSAWCLAALAQSSRPGLAGVVYAGVGAGIALAGLHCLAGTALGAKAASLWWQLGAAAALLGAVFTALVTPVRPSEAVQPSPRAFRQTTAAPTSTTAGERALVLCYGCFGFGYILPATFLPALARNVVHDPAVFGWTWPVFGVAAALSTLIAGAWFARTDRLRLWRVAQWLMAVGTAAPGLWPSAPAVLLSALLVGGTFMIVTMAGLQEARARGGDRATALLGRMTAAFSIGQIAGPLGSALLTHGAVGAASGMRIALVLAALVLGASTLWLKRWPSPGYVDLSPVH